MPTTPTSTGPTSDSRAPPRPVASPRSTVPRQPDRPSGALPKYPSRRLRPPTRLDGMSPHTPGTPPPHTVWHCLQCTDARTQIDWMVTALGFIESFSHTEGATVAHARSEERRVGKERRA